MILFMECIITSLIFGIVIVGSTLYKKEAWLQEYAPEVQRQFLEANPDYVPKEKEKKKISLIITKLSACILFTLILSGLVYLAGADNFRTGFLYSYIIWTVVNIFDAIVLDILIFGHWKKVRLPGTEDMDKEYASNGWKCIKDGFIGVLIGIPVCCLCGLIIMIIL